MMEQCFKQKVVSEQSESYYSHCRCFLRMPQMAMPRTWLGSRHRRDR